MEHKRLKDMAATLIRRQLGRDVMRCQNCKLVQFKRSQQKCPKCHRPYFEAKIIAPVKHEEQLPPPLIRPGNVVRIDKAVPVALRAIREWRGMSQQDAAVRGNLARPHLSEYERGINMPFLATLPKLCAALGVSVYFFMRVCDELQSAN